METKVSSINSITPVIPEVYIPPQEHGLGCLSYVGGQHRNPSSSEKHRGYERKATHNHEPLSQEHIDVALNEHSGQALNTYSSPVQENITHEACNEVPTQVLEAGDSSEFEEEGFIPINDLSLVHLPDSIKTGHNLQVISSIARRVVCINNNGLSPDRPPEFKFNGAKTLKGTGFLFFIEGDTAVVSTNKHILFNDAEVRQASIDVFYDRSFKEYKPGETRRVGRGKGLGTIRSNKKDDFTFAIFQLDSDIIARLQEREVTEEDGLPVIVSLARHSFPVTMLPTEHASSQDGDAEAVQKMVCVISHPEGAHKHVSFGLMVTEDLTTGAFEHDAATRHGSSGAPILVFSPTPMEVPPDSVWYHIGRLDSGHKIAHLQRNDSQLFDVNLIDDERFDMDLLSRALDYPKPSVDILLRWTRNMDMAKILSNLSALMRMLSLSACLGSFLHNPDIEVLEKWQQHLQTLVDAVTDARNTALQKPPPEPTLTRDTLTSHDVCTCSSFWEAVRSCHEYGVNHPSNRGTFLLPHSTPSDLRDCPTWPFNEVPPRGSLDALHKDGECCFLRDILTDLELQDADESDIFGYILFLLRRILHTMKCLVSLRPNIEDEPITSLESGAGRGSHPPVTDESYEEMKRQAIKSVLDLMDFGLASYNFAFVLWHVVCSKFLDLYELMMEPDSEGPCPNNESKGTGPDSCRSEIRHQGSQATAMAVARQLLHHTHVHYGQVRHDDQEAAGTGTDIVPCDCGRPVPLALEEATKHLKALIEDHTPSTDGSAKQVPDSGQTAEKPAGASFAHPGRTAASEPIPVGEASGVLVEGEVPGSSFVEWNDEPDLNERSVDATFLLEANSEETKGETDTKKKMTRKERLFCSSKQSFERVLLRMKHSVRQYVTHSFGEEDNPTRLPNGDEHFEMVMVTFPKLLSVMKASLNTMIALHCFKQGQTSTDAGPGEAVMSEEDVGKLKDALPKTLPILLRHLISAEVFLHNSRLFLELSHPLLSCNCENFADRLGRTPSDHETQEPGARTDPVQDGNEVAKATTKDKNETSPRVPRDGEEDTHQEDAIVPASEASKEEEAIQGERASGFDDQPTSKTIATDQGGSPAADAIIAAVRRVDAPSLTAENLEVICTSLSSLQFLGLTAEDVRPLCDVIEALDLNDIQAEDFTSLCDVIRALDLGGLGAEDIRSLCDGARSKAVGKIKREDVQSWLGLLKLLNLNKLSRSEISHLVTLARTMTAGKKQ